MESVFHYVAPPSQCGYLPDQTWRLEYEVFGRLAPAEYMKRMASGWRRFGDTLFRPHCPNCNACRSLRVPVDRFRPNRSQRRVRTSNAGEVALRIGTPSVTRAKLDLYDRYHAHQAVARGWPFHDHKDVPSYVQSFVANPFSTQEWCYFIEDQLVGVGYVDDLPAGLSAIYFYYDPDLRQRSLGTWNILCLLHEAAFRKIPYVYLGYYVAGCPSMVYKSHFVPNQLLGTDGRWTDFRT